MAVLGAVIKHNMIVYYGYNDVALKGLTFSVEVDMDTKYFKQALEEYCKKHRFDAATPITAHQLSEILTAAQKLKDADRAAVQPEPTA